MGYEGTSKCNSAYITCPQGGLVVWELLSLADYLPHAVRISFSTIQKIIHLIPESYFRCLMYLLYSW